MDYLMTAETAEILAALFAGLILLGAMINVWSGLVAKLKEHDIRITSGESIAENTARILERSSLQIAAIEERTKHL